jgi:hypothetical protein
MSLSDLARRLIAPRNAAPAAPVQAAPAPVTPPAPSRFVEGRVEFRGMLWHPVIGLADAERLIVSVKAGLPHCQRCDKALSLQGSDWGCAACGERRPGADVDFFAMDCVIAEDLVAFFREHPDYSPAPGLNVPARALQAAA